MQGFDIIFGYVRRRAGLVAATAGVLRAGVQAALEVNDRSMTGGRSAIARADAMTLHLGEKER